MYVIRSYYDVSIFDERILYSDKWYANFEYIGKIIISTNQPDEFLLYGFSGTAISCFAPKNNRSGYIDIYLDGIRITSYNVCYTKLLRFFMFLYS